MRAPTDKQAGLLRVLAGGCTALAPGRRDWGPLVRRGWVTPVSPDDKDKRFFPPLEITPDGLRALAGHLESHPPEPWGEREKPKQLNESPRVERLKTDAAELKAERDEAKREMWQATRRLRAIAAVMKDWESA